MPAQLEQRRGGAENAGVKNAGVASKGIATDEFRRKCYWINCVKYVEDTNTAPE